MNRWSWSSVIDSKLSTPLRINQEGSKQSKLWRRLWHLLGGSFFSILALFISRETLLITLGAMTAIFLTWEIVRFTSTSVNRWMVSHLRVMLKREEGFRLTGTT